MAPILGLFDLIATEPAEHTEKIIQNSILINSFSAVSMRSVVKNRHPGPGMIEKSIAVIGSTTIDKIVRRNFSRFKIGGVTTYSGMTYSRHGIKTWVVTNVAKRDREIIKRLEQESIVVCNGPTEVTTYFRNLLDDNEKNRKQNILQQAAPINRSQMIEHLKDVAFVHLGPLHPSDIDLRAIELISRLKHFVILDIQGFVRTVKNKVVYPAVSEHLPAAMRVSQIVKANRQEYEAFIDFFRTDLLELMRQFNINEFVVTSGHKGGFVQTITGEETPYPAAGVASNEDPTGAGDIFLAAYVIGRFFNQRSIADSCKYAAKLAARQIEGNYIKPNDLGLKDRKQHQL
jgi:sugar/nucleoside kinase (ribokinase family)